MSSIRTKTALQNLPRGQVLFLPLQRVTGFLHVPRSPVSIDGHCHVASLTPNRLSFSNLIGLRALGSTYPPLSLGIAIAAGEFSSRSWWQHPYYIAGAVAVFLLVIADLYLRKRAKQRRQMIQEIERLEKEKWLKKAKGEDAESVLKKRLGDLNIDPSTKNIDTFENKIKVALEIALADINAVTAEYKDFNNPRFLMRFSKLPYMLQKKVLDHLQSKRQKLADGEGQLEKLMYELKDRLPEIHTEFSVVSRAIQGGYKTFDHLATELSRRTSKESDDLDDDGGSDADDIGKDDLATLEEKYAPLGVGGSLSFIRATVAQLRRQDLERVTLELKEQSKSYAGVLATASLAQKQEVLGIMREAKECSPNYLIIFKKYLGDYPDLLRAARKYDEAVDDAIAEVQESIDHHERNEAVRKETTEFVERSLPRKRVMIVNDIVVAYEHQYDSIQNLIRGFLKPAEIQQKITEVLTANPDADLVPLEGSLGIKVISVQRKGKEKKGPSAGSIYVGSDE